MKRNVEVRDLMRVQMVSDPQISPDGTRIAFVHTAIDYNKNDYISNIWLAEIETGHLAQFTLSRGKDKNPRWSPDGKSLLFTSLPLGEEEKERKIQLYVIPTAGGEARQITDRKNSVESPQWAPDGKSILFISQFRKVKPNSDVKVIKRIRYKLDGVGFFDGKRKHLFTIPAYGGKLMQLTEGEFDIEKAKWSPNGKTIAFVTNKDGDADISRVKDIFLVPSKGGKSQKLTEGQHIIADVSWSPDGKKLAFFGHDLPEGLARGRDLWLMSSRGSEMRNLTKNFDRSIDGFPIGSDLRVLAPKPGVVWSLDGGSIYFLAVSNPHSNIYNVGVDGGPVGIVVGDKSIDGFSLSRDGSVIAFTAMDATHPSELWVKDGCRKRRLTGFNDKLLKELCISTPEHFTFRNRLGKNIDGWILRPPDFQEGEQYPMVLEIHGGPRATYGDAIFHEFQVLAACGYVIIYTNPRGSAGYGEDYAQAVMGHYGECDYEDLMMFVDEALERFSFIDRNRLGVIGGSYGGYMTNWIVTHTDRFKAAVTLKSYCNWFGKFGSSDIGPNWRWNMDGLPWNDEEKYMSKSPIRYVKNVKTPTLIIHSEEDYRSPIGGAEQFFTSLKFLGVPTELVRFPGESHDLNRSGKPKHREERLDHIIRWFKTYL